MRTVIDRPGAAAPHLLLFGLLVRGVVGCAAAPSGSGCQQDLECGAGAACVASTCVPRAARHHFHVELIPRPESPAAHTELELSGPAPARTPLPLLASTKIGVNLAPIDPAWGILGLGEEGTRILLKHPSRLPGREPLVWGGPAIKEATGPIASPARLALDLPAALIGSEIDIELQPVVPLDRALPPWRVRLPLAPLLTVSLPGTAELTTLEGRVESLLGRPLAGLTVRARPSSTSERVSNLATTDAQGTFRLTLARELVGVRDQPLDLVLVQSTERGLPELVLPGVVAHAGSLPPITFPAHPVPEKFRVPVVGLRAAGAVEPVVGAQVHLSTSLPASAMGRATYTFQARTDISGHAQVALIPGEVGVERTYALVVTTLPESKFASRCVAAYTIVSSGLVEETRTTAELQLAPKPILRGQLLRPDGRAAAGVTIRASRVAGPQGPPCPAAAPPANVQTGLDGRFALAVEPGRQRIEYLPAQGAPYPYFSEILDVSQDTTVSRRLPEGRLLDAIALFPGGQPAAGVEVRVHALDEAGSARLIGRALSDPDGTVRIVVP